MTKEPWMAAVLLVGLAVGVPSGVGGYTFLYARGLSYMTNDPEACANCHVMQSHLDAWRKSSHHSVAVCNDCHTPHSLIPKYLTKGLNGYHHSVAFTLGNFPDNIQITPRNRKVTEDACRYCHSDIVQSIDRFHSEGNTLSCLQCHESVGHLE